MPLSLRRPAVSLFRSRGVSPPPPLFYSLPLLCLSLSLPFILSAHREDDNGDRKRGESETGITRDGVAPVNGCGRMVASAGAHRDTLRLDAAELSQLSRTHAIIRYGRCDLGSIVCKININEDPRGFSL